MVDCCPSMVSLVDLCLILVNELTSLMQCLLRNSGFLMHRWDWIDRAWSVLVLISLILEISSILLSCDQNIPVDIQVVVATILYEEELLFERYSSD